MSAKKPPCLGCGKFQGFFGGLCLRCHRRKQKTGTTEKQHKRRNPETAQTKFHDGAPEDATDEELDAIIAEQMQTAWWEPGQYVE